MDRVPEPGAEYVNLDEIDVKADQLHDAVDIYDRFEEERLYESEELPSEIESYLKELDRESIQEGISPGIVLASEIKHMVLELEDMVGQYTEQHRPGKGQKDWKEILDKTESARRATRRAYDAGYQKFKPDPHTTDFDKGCTVPREMSVSRILDDERSFNINANFLSE